MQNRCWLNAKSMIYLFACLIYWTFTYLLLRSSCDFAINGRAVTLDTVNRLSLSSSSNSVVRLLPINSRNTDFVDRFCWSKPFPSMLFGTMISLLILIESALAGASCNGAEWMENNEPFVLNSLNSATSAVDGWSHCLIDDALESCMLNADDWNFSSNVSRVSCSIFGLN